MIKRVRTCSFKLFTSSSALALLNPDDIPTFLDTETLPRQLGGLLGRLVKRLDVELGTQRNDPLGVVLGVGVEVMFLNICLSALSCLAVVDIRSKLVVSLKAALFQYNLLSQSWRYGKSCRTDH